MKILEGIVDIFKFKSLDNASPFYYFKHKNKNFDVTF